jgi:integrase/recombinase XerD
MRRIGEQNAVFCSRILFPVNRSRSFYFSMRILVLVMSGSLFDQTGARKYLIASERLAFIRTAMQESDVTATFCLTLAISGARISEVLAVTADRVDLANGTIVFETLKQRKRALFRAVPMPDCLLRLIMQTRRPSGTRLWPWGRTTAWKLVKDVMRRAGIAERLCKPKSLRHAFAVEAGQEGVPLNIVQRWLGHARLETTAIYMSVLGEEERNLARRTWACIETTISRNGLF